MVGHTTFRPAVKADASALAVLVDIAGEGLPAHLWNTLRAPGQSILEVGRERAAREAGGFSYRNAVVAEVDGRIVRREEFPRTPIQDGQQIELIKLMGGG